MSLSVVEMDGAIFYPKLTFANILYARRYCNLSLVDVKCSFCPFSTLNMHPFLVHFRLHVLATVKGIYCRVIKIAIALGYTFLMFVIEGYGVIYI